MKEAIQHMKVTVLGGGIAQVLAEASRIIGRSDPEKFPHGWASLNPIEEFAEGSLSSLTGAVAMELVYLGLVRAGTVQPNRQLERKLILLGGFLGYTSMVILGAYLHEINNVPDVKWGPFK